MQNTFKSSHKLTNLKVPKDKRKRQDIIKKAQKTIPILEGGIIIPAVFLIFGGAIFFLGLEQFFLGKKLSVVFLFGFAIVLFTLFIRALLRRSTPFFILTPQGLVTSVFKTVLPWHAITDFQINATKSNAYNITIMIEFEINDKFLPLLHEKCRPASYYDAKSKMLKIAGLNFRRNMNRDKLIDLINDYRLADIAQQKYADK